MSVTVRARFVRRFRGGAAVNADFALGDESGPVTVLFGPSGSGKSTVLRCIAGLDRPDEGSLEVRGAVWSDAARAVFWPPQARNVGYLAQDYALFPHLTVAENVGFGLAREARAARVAELLARLDIASLASRRPSQLSGGQKQRTALARALSRSPALLLLDEPLSALDAPSREQLRGELRRLLRALAVPALVVTHDRTEAMALGDSMVVLDAGRVRQVGRVEEVFSRPADLAVARIVGTETVAPGTVVRAHEGLVTVSVAGREVVAVDPGGLGHEVFVCVRAEDVSLARADAGVTSARNRWEGRVTALSPEGALTRVTLECGFTLVALVTRQSASEMRLAEGDAVTAVVKAPAVRVIPRGE